METLDPPVKLKYSYGKLFPANAVFIGYIFLAVSVFSFLLGAWIIGLIIMLIGLVISLTWSEVKFNPEAKEFTEQINYLGFIPISKRYYCKNWKYITVLPVKLTTTVYSRSTNYTNLTEYYFAITLLNANYRNKKELVQFESRNSGEEIAKELGTRLGLDYFDYDPSVIRESFRR